MKNVFALIGLLTVVGFLNSCAPAETADTADEALAMAEDAASKASDLESRIMELEDRVDQLEWNQP